MSQTYFNWGDMGISDTLETLPRPKDDQWSLRKDRTESVYVKVSFYEKDAHDRRAVTKALRTFRKHTGSTAKIYKTLIIEKNLIVLFTSRQIEYTIEIIADYESACVYYDSILAKETK
jgi:hypothetical protein